MFSPAAIIQKKRDGHELSDEEIGSFISGFVKGDVTDYQATALLMAIYFRGMSPAETVSITKAMLQSGDRMDLSHISGPKVDKHSTGGIGDKISLILAPLAAACGLKVPMMSGRGLGHTGGTLDKLESILGFDVRPSREKFEETLAKTGCAMIGQSEKIAPADRKLYGLRDVTGTVECIPLITASILSKKLAEGIGALVLDVKVGSGAFMKNRVQAKKLAVTMINVAKKLGLSCRALLTDMNQPLGYAVGNSLEMIEAINILRNDPRPMVTMAIHDRNIGSSDVRELSIQLCAHMLELGGAVKNIAEGRKLAHSRLADLSAWKVFQDLVRAQSGSVEQVLNPQTLPLAPKIAVWKAAKKGYIAKMNCETIGRVVVELGGGRKKHTDSVDPGVGLVFHRKLGSKVSQGDPIVSVFGRESRLPPETLANLENEFKNAVEITSTRKSVPKLILERIN